MKRSYVLLVACALALNANADIVLRQSTASQAVQIGPFVDTTGAVVSGLTIANTDVRISKNGADITAKNSGGCTYDEVGMYTCTFDATDSNTAGRLQVTVNKTGALPVYHEFQVATQSIFDSCCASGAASQAFPTNFASLAITGGGAVTAGTVSDKTGYSLSSTQTFNNTGTWTGNLTGTVGTATNLTNLPTMPTDWITAAGLSAGANTELGGVVADSVWDEARAGHTTAGTFGFYLDSAISGVAVGGGSADWTTDERTAIRSILGVPGSGTTPVTPTTGVLDTLNDNLSDVPTNAELATALAGADDATLAAISALNNLSIAQVRAIVVEDQGATASLGCVNAVALAVLAGRASVSGDTVTYRDPSNGEIRAVITHDTSGNRTASSITCPSY